MNRLSCNQCSLRTLAGNDADPVDPRQTPGWQKASLAAAGPPLLPQADRAEPSRMSAQTPITECRQSRASLISFGTAGVAWLSAGGYGAACSPKVFERGRKMRPWVRNPTALTD
jgi:hypothetical protein